MQRNLLWAIVIVVVLGGGYLWWQSTQTPADTTGTTTGTSTGTIGSTTGDEPGAGSEDNFAASVAFDGTAFTPSTVTIKKGETVRWNNTSDKNVWPASAVHPTHSVYPEKTASDCLGSAFDACRGLIPGELWDFTFNQMGTWRYHNHSNPSITGTVVVTE
ncbi:MAG: hypothetical protein HYS26_04000 [Candidatus Kaiserbacteria bacterium]|nr:MAG: hypothetical protein HYS26_04000 [Candidatus Kaiserbacteria bacterium]